MSGGTKEIRKWTYWFKGRNEFGRVIRIKDIVKKAVAIRKANHMNWDEYEPSLVNWRDMGTTISKCKILKEIILDDPDHRLRLTADFLADLFQAGGPYNFQIEHLDLSNNEFGSVGIQNLVPFLRTQQELDSLLLIRNDIDDEGARFIAGILNETVVRRLDISFNPINPRSVSIILSSQNSNNIRQLGLEGIRICRAEIDALAQFLGQGCIELTHMKIGDSNQSFMDDIGVEGFEILMGSLRRNETIKLLAICADPYKRIQDIASKIELSDQIASSIMSAVCDVSTFEALVYESNHTLECAPVKVSYGCQDMNEALRINSTKSGFNLNQKVRRKLRSFYFRQEFDIQPFLSLKTVFMPQFLEILSQSEEFLYSNLRQEYSGKYVTSRSGNLKAMYRFVRHWNLPDLFTFHSRQVEVDSLKLETRKLESKFDSEVFQLKEEHRKALFESDQKIRKLEAERKETQQKIQELEHALSRLKETNQQIVSENEEYRLKHGQLPKKRQRYNSK